MMHSRRRFCVSPVATAAELAHMLTERTWTLCSGFYVVGHENYLFLNDATHEDGAAEFGVYGAVNVMLSWYVGTRRCSQSRALFITQRMFRNVVNNNFPI
jgi:hypothetical protein